MATRYFALIAGVVYVLVGIAGFIPGLNMHHIPPADLNVEANYGLLFGLFPVNSLHNIVHLAIGAWGIVAYRTLPNAVTYSKGLTIIYGLLTVMGLFPVLNTMFGLVPLYGHDIWLHALTMLVALYFGFIRHEGRTGGFNRTASSH